MGVMPCILALLTSVFIGRTIGNDKASQEVRTILGPILPARSITCFTTYLLVKICVLTLLLIFFSSHLYMTVGSIRDTINHSSIHLSTNCCILQVFSNLPCFPIILCLNGYINFFISTFDYLKASVTT